MIKKMLFVLLTVSLLAALVVVPALAEGDGPGGPGGPGRRGRAIGQVTEIGSDSFTVSSPQGEERVIQVTDETAFHNFDGSEAQFADLTVGAWVGGHAEQNDDENWTAVNVILLPEDFEPGAFKPGHGLGGEVLSTSVNSITIETHLGEEITVTVNVETEYVGGIASLSEVEVGMQIGIAVEKQDDDSLLAVQVLAGPYSGEERAVGLITEIGSDSLTIEARDGDALTFSVDADTEFLSRDNSLTGLDDLETEQGVLVFYETLDDGSLHAIAIGARVDGPRGPGGFGGPEN
ncbi:MAG: hypothetical protein EPO32_04810 [Anaerolineae bacterium]|nr:MAG: hypothetical protein EPO32_04810 [Anaerolineae bacterium]